MVGLVSVFVFDMVLIQAKDLCACCHSYYAVPMHNTCCVLLLVNMLSTILSSYNIVGAFVMNFVLYVYM